MRGTIKVLAVLLGGETSFICTEWNKNCLHSSYSRRTITHYNYNTKTMLRELRDINRWSEVTHFDQRAMLSRFKAVNNSFMVHAMF